MSANYLTHLPLITIDLDGRVIGTAYSNKLRSYDTEPPEIYVAPPKDRPLRSVVSPEERERAIRLFNERYPVEPPE